MKTRRPTEIKFIAIILLAAAAFQADVRSNPQNPAGASDLVTLQNDFKAPPPDSRIMMRWWWFGPAVTKAQLEREMVLMKEGGIGGFEVQPVYPVALDDPASGIKTLPYLSDEFIEALRFTSEKARALGLRMDLTLGSGWPYGGPKVLVSESAGKLRIQRVPVDAAARRVPLPDIGAGEKLLAVYLAQTKGKTPAGGSFKELTDIADGAVRLPAAPENPQEVVCFISGHTGQMVKRAAVDAEGFVLDHYDRTAVENYQKSVGDRLMQAFVRNPPYAVFCDSLEVYGSDWTGDFLEQFRKRRGYDLKPHLPALIADVGPKTADIRHDWGQILTELLDENFIAPMREWARRKRTLFRLQGYGIPPATISSNSLVDLAEGEGAQWKILSASRWASSANHLNGRPVTSSETWTWLHSPTFRATPLDVKAEADLHFLQGINQLIGHGWPYTAEGVAYPGWRFYAAGVFNDKNPWWIVMPDLSRYLQRLSFLLRQGKPSNDIGLYLPDSDAWSSFADGGHVHMIEALRARIGPDIVAKVLEAGFNPDFFDDGSLRKMGRVGKGVLGIGPTTYKTVILPNVERIPLDTLRRFEEFSRAGGILIATRRLPAIAPGFLATDSETEQVRQISSRLFEGPSAPSHFVKDEIRELGAMLAKLTTPDVSLSPSAPEIGFVHRSTPVAEIYFLANTANVPQDVRATFRIQGLNAELWDPMSGEVSPVALDGAKQGVTTISLRFEPYGSHTVVFSKRAAGRVAGVTTPAVSSTIDLSRDWQVSFGMAGKPVRMESLKSWEELDETRYFSGQAVYEKETAVPEEMLRAGVHVRLSFGDGKPLPGQKPNSRMQAWLDAPVREAAVVYVNGRRAGSVWCPPYSVDVSGMLVRGKNRLRIVVGNLAINHMAGRALPDYRLLNLRYGTRFEPQDMKDLRPLPSGLLGPIRLLATD